MCPRVPIHFVKLTAASAAGWSSTCPRAHTVSASHLHLSNSAVRHVQCMDIVTTVCAHVSWVSQLRVMVFAQAIWFADRLFAAQYTFAPHSDTSRYTREYGQTSSSYNKEWVPPTKQHTKNSYSGWSKRATRGYIPTMMTPSAVGQQAKWTDQGQ